MVRVGKLFSELKLVTDNFFIHAAANWGATKLLIHSFCCLRKNIHSHLTHFLGFVSLSLASGLGNLSHSRTETWLNQPEIISIKYLPPISVFRLLPTWIMKRGYLISYTVASYPGLLPMAWVWGYLHCKQWNNSILFPCPLPQFALTIP